MEKGPLKSRPDYHETTRAIVSMNKEACQTPKINKKKQISRGSGPSEARLAFLALTQLEMVLRGEPKLRLPRSTHLWWSVESKLVDHAMVGEIKVEMERRSLEFFFKKKKISHPRCGNFCVCDGGCARTPCRTHIFLMHFPCVTYKHRVHAGRISSLHLTLSIPMFHPPSLLFPHGHFETTFLSAPSSSNGTRPESAGQAHFRTSAEEFGYLADPTHSTSFEPREFDRTTSVDGDTTTINDPNQDSISDFSKTTRENTGLFGVPAMFETSVSHVSHGEFALQRECQECMPRETVARQREIQREREKRFCDQCWRVDVKEKSTQKHQESFSSDSQRILFWWTRSPWTPGTKSSTSCSWWKFSSERKKFLDWVRHGHPKFGAKKFRVCIDWVATRAWISKTTTTGSQSMGRSSSTWENTLVQWVGNEVPSSPGMLRNKLPRNWRIEKTLLWRRKWSNSTKDEWIFYAAWSGVSNSESITGSSSEITRTIGIYWRFENLPRSWLTECPTFHIKLLFLRVPKNLAANRERSEIHERT